MAKKTGKCVHCLKDNVELTSDHMFPKAWYPDATPKDLEKWQIPSCLDCNQRYGKLENDLLGRVALTLDAKNPLLPGLLKRRCAPSIPLRPATKAMPQHARPEPKKFWATCSRENR